MPGPLVTRALRGATTVAEDDPDQIATAIRELLTEVMGRNGLVEEELVSILFTATTDLVSANPATAARTIGFGSVPLMCAAEMNVAHGTPRCLRVLVHINTDRSRAELRHVYLHGAQGLRDDLPA